MSAPELPTLFDKETLIKKGLVPVAKERAVETHNIYYELHGAQEDVKERIVFIMGLNNSCFGWTRQVKYFARKPGYQVLVFDNKGVGNSDLAKGLYKTSEMAEDAVELLDYVGWKDTNSINIVGVSMGGMILQHVTLLVPERVNSILLLSTKTSHVPDLPPVKGIAMFTRLIGFGRLLPERRRIDIMVDGLFPSSYLDQPVPDDDPEVEHRGQLRRKVVEEEFMHRYLTARKQPVKGSFAQLAAAIGHRITAEQSKQISAAVGKVMIVTGDDDNLINHNRSYDMEKLFPNSELVVVKGGGHALPYQTPEELNKLIERTITEGRAKNTERA